jgi:hypothetical protein
MMMEWQEIERNEGNSHEADTTESEEGANEALCCHQLVLTFCAANERTYIRVHGIVSRQRRILDASRGFTENDAGTYQSVDTCSQISAFKLYRMTR